MRQRALLCCLLVSLIGLLAAPLGAAPSSPPPPDPLAARDALVVTVAAGGIQRLSGADLAAAGLALAELDPAHLWLRRAGAPVPLELRLGDDGRLDPADELRFYAPAPGDRWNAAEPYWLAVEAMPGPQMTVRAVPPAMAPERGTARERGEAYAPAFYDSRRPGPDGDHWFAADLRAEPGATTAYTLTLAPALPAAPGATALTIAGQSFGGGPARIEARLGAASAADTWATRASGRAPCPCLAAP